MSAFQAVQVTLPTSGSVDATISGFGTPKGAIVIMSNCATTNGSSVSNRFSVGFWDGAAQVCSASGARNGQGTMISRRQSFNDRIAVALNFAGGTPIIEYTIANITDGVRLSVAAGSTTITRIATVVLIGGSDITSVACDQLDLGNTTAAVDHSTIGFEPNIVFVTGSGAGEGVDAAGSNLSFGVAINTGSTVTQRSFTYQDRPSVSTTINDAYVSDTAVAAQLNNRSLLWDCSLSAFDSGGFSTTTSSAAGNDDIMTLSIETALDVSIQDNFLPLSGNVNDTSVGFEPSFVLFGMAEFDNVFDDLDVGYGVSISVYDATNTAEYTLGVASRDNVGTTDSESYHSNNSSLIKWDDGSTAAEFTTTVDSLGYDMTFTANPSTGFRVWSLCVGQPTGGGSNNYDVDINAGSFSVTGGALDLLAARQLSLGAGSFSLVGGGLDLRRGRLLSLESGSFSVAGGDIEALYNRLISLEAGSFDVTGGDLEQRLGRILGLEAGSFSVNGGDLTLTALSQNVLTLEAGTFAINGGSVNLLADRLLNIEGGNFSVNGGDISFLTGYVLDLEAGTILLTGQDLNFDKTNVITLEAGDILITGGRINFDYSNAATPSTIIFHHESGLETPTVTDLHPGEIGVNVTTGKIWTLNDDYLLVEVGGLYHGRNLPRIDPAVAGEFWNNDGTLSVSNG